MCQVLSVNLRDDADKVFALKAYKQNWETDLNTTVTQRDVSLETGKYDEGTGYSSVKPYDS